MALWTAERIQRAEAVCINANPSLDAHGLRMEMVAEESCSPLVDLEDFVDDHRPHGTLTADAMEPAWNGYRLTIACACSVVFDRWVTPWDAEHDMIGSALFASPN